MHLHVVRSDTVSVKSGQETLWTE